MKTTIPSKRWAKILEKAKVGDQECPQPEPDEIGGRQPVHVVYGGAQLFDRNTISKLGDISLRAMQEYAPDAGSLTKIFGIPAEFSDIVYERVHQKLLHDPIEDYRIDFEDGFGVRSEADEDRFAAAAAAETAGRMKAGGLPRFFGIRIKPLSPEHQHRALRTLDIFISELSAVTESDLPGNFVITLPKVSSPYQVEGLNDALSELESGLGLESGALRIELMVETPGALISRDGRVALPALVQAGHGRCRGMHFGAYDYTAALGVTAEYQDMLHPACDFARSIMQASMAGTGVWLSDGATNVMPIGPNRGKDLTQAQRAENHEAVHLAWQLHYRHCRRSLANGFYQGWDLHPAQFFSRYAALYTFFHEGMDAMSNRLRNFLNEAAQATLSGSIFDDAATGQGLLNYFLKAVNCGAVSEEQMAAVTGLSFDEVRAGSFTKIVEHRASKRALNLTDLR